MAGLRPRHFLTLHGMAHFYTGVNPVSCALRGRTALTPECQGGFPSLRSVQGALSLAPFHRYPCPNSFGAGHFDPYLTVCSPPARSTGGYFYLHKEVDTINKTVEQLKAEKAKNEQEIAQARRRNQRLDNRIRYLTDGERKKRNHRLITRGAAIECLAPVVKGMGETDFFDLMEKVFSLPEVKALLPVEEGGERS